MPELPLVLLFFGGDDQGHAATEHLRLADHFAVFGQLFRNLTHHLVAVFDMHHFATAKEHCKLHLVPFFEKFHGVLGLDIAIVIVNFRPQTNFLQRHHMLFFLAQLLFAFLLVQIFPVIHDPADRRFRVRRNLHKVQSKVMGPKLGFLDINNTDLVIVFIDQADRIGSDPLIDA